MKYGFVYIWHDRGKDRWYLGCNWGHEKDGYVCSSNWMNKSIKKRPQDFKRRILVTNIPTKQQTIDEEYKWLCLIKKEELGKRYYNLRNQRYEVKDMTGENNPMFGVSLIPWNKGKSGYKVKPCSQERKDKIGKANRHPLTDEHKAKLSAAHIGKSSPKKGIPMKSDQVEKLKAAWVKRKERLASGEEVHWTHKTVE